MKETKISINQTARITAVLYLIITVIAPFSMLYMPSVLVVPGNAAATFANISASEGLFRAGMASDSVVFLIEIAITALLYVLLKPVSQPLTLTAAFARLAMTIIQGVNLISYVLVLLLVNGAGYLSAFAPEQMQALVMLLLNVHTSVALIWGLFFGLHLLVLGYLVYRSGYLPKLVGVALVIAGACYLSQSFVSILLPQYKAIIDQVVLISMVELAFPLWLLIKGVDSKGWGKYSQQGMN